MTTEYGNLDAQRRTEQIFEIFRNLVDAGAKTVRPGQVNAVLREKQDPMGAWEVRGIFSILEAQGLIEVVPESGDWTLTAAGAEPLAKVAGDNG